MRILQINDLYKEKGGAETYLIEIVKYLKKKHDVYVFGFSDKKIKDKDKLILEEDKNHGLKRTIKRFFFNYKAFKNLKAYIKEIKPDIIHLHNNYLYSNSILLALKSYNGPIIQTVHDWGLICPSSWCIIKKNLKMCPGVNGISPNCLNERCLSIHHFLVTYLRNKIRLRLTKKYINLFISPSVSLKNYLQSKGFKNVICLHHFIEFENIKLKKRDENHILYVGALSKNKGVEYLIKAFPMILKEISSSKITIIGEGPERDRLEYLSKKQKTSKKIKFLGKLPHKEVINYFKKASVFVLPSIWMENSPFVLYECLSTGLPVVGSERGGIVDLVKDNETGFLSKPANSEDIAKKIIKILNNKNLAKKFSKNSIKIAKDRFNSKKHVENLEKIYNKFVK